ncbi:glycoside hydrolase/phage tail family protein [Pseudooceanicola nanhaiensis]|uniref:baseplate multidomain protein megatron n=1 Tax=Pseudooceanicola nanhaiensis TaxID=375761 RepID=UPI001CD5C89E|nr:glycoside hydrolase/phage tail family protein [Pseudooceanicola nanhaiensis]MCA0922916.1 glycoside hydrolase/phage tail family protein [Pseudooceanicola nanhaiensis]
MATILLSAVGAAVGGSLGGSVLGLSAAVAGRFVGATVGRVIDQSLMGRGSDVIESGRIDRFRLTGAGEGEPVARLHGRMRVAGQVIWASRFTETVTTSGGGKGAPARPTVERHSYSVSLAIALCEGEISGVGRIWADGGEIARDDLTLRVYRGGADQQPDPKMEAVEGAGLVPAYRGTAYVVIEELDLAPYGNRVPQFSFEVMRPAPAALPGAGDVPPRAVRAVAMMPGTGEYTLATTPVSFDLGAGQVRMANVNSPAGKSDFSSSLDQLEASLPNCGAVSLVVSWFGDDLRMSACELRPRAEQGEQDGTGMPWQVAGVARAAAGLVPRDVEDRPVYGGTPADAAVVEAIREMTARGQEVMFYPFILMTQAAENGLSDPHTGATDQPVLPWRGRITLAAAPGQPGSSDGTAVADVEVSEFFGTASASDFTVGDGEVSYSGPEEWRYRRFVLHYAALCAAAGGVESFCIGSEMVGLTTVRGAAGYPAVQALRQLAGEVRALLGPGCKISYAADWSEYFGHHPQDGSGDVRFHLDPLWADPEIDFIGIDNYLPLSDWREGEDHLDTGWGTIYDLDYLRSGVEGGQYYDWYYHSPEAEAAQIRTPIEDGAHGEHWVYRTKDIRGWWENLHYERIDGERQAIPTGWQPGMKPVRFTELGCAAVDKGTNEPNKFLDPKSSESALPRHSTGRRDDLIQMQYLTAVLSHWGANNPQSEVYGGPMLDMDHAYVWAWDARPFPFFPAALDTWADGENYARGHWITGRAAGRDLASVVAEICEGAGVADYDVSGLHGYVAGYVEDRVMPGRTALQPLMLRFGFDAVEREGQLVFRMRDGRVDAEVTEEALALHPEIEGTLEETRAPEAELTGRVRVRFLQGEADYAVIAEEAVLPGEDTGAVSASELPMVLSRGLGRQVAERWLSEARLARDSLRLALPPSRGDLGPGDVLQVGARGLFRLDRVERAGALLAEAVRIEPETYRPVDMDEDSVALSQFVPPVPVFPLFLDLPLMRGEEVPHAPHLAVTSVPWPGSVALYASDQDSDYALNRTLSLRATVGVAQTALGAGPVGRIDRGAGLSVRLTSGGLSSISDAALLSGGNLMAIGDGTPGGWELFQFRDAVLTGENTYLLSHLLRGQFGTDAAMPEAWPEGSYVVLMNGAAEQIDLALGQRRMARHYRIGPAQRAVSDPSYRHETWAFDGIGLRPYAPCHLSVAETAGDLAFGWVRRTRIDGDSWEGIEVPLGEESESYLVRVVQGGVVRREAITATPAWTYDAAARAADGLSGLAELEVAQISASFGAGAVARLVFAV